MKRRTHRSRNSAPVSVQLRPAAYRDRDQALRWWVANHGPLAPSRLEAELEQAFRLLAANPELGYASSWRGKLVRKLRLACRFFVLYRAHSSPRRVIVLRILAASRLHG